MRSSLVPLGLDTGMIRATGRPDLTMTAVSPVELNRSTRLDRPAAAASMVRTLSAITSVYGAVIRWSSATLECHGSPLSALGLHRRDVLVVLGGVVFAHGAETIENDGWTADG